MSAYRSQPPKEKLSIAGIDLSAVNTEKVFYINLSPANNSAPEKRKSLDQAKQFIIEVRERKLNWFIEIVDNIVTSPKSFGLRVYPLGKTNEQPRNS